MDKNSRGIDYNYHLYQKNLFTLQYRYNNSSIDNNTHIHPNKSNVYTLRSEEIDNRKLVKLVYNLLFSSFDGNENNIILAINLLKSYLHE